MKIRALIITNQHGFIKNKSTITNLSLYIQNLVETMSNGLATRAFNTDFCSAFHVVNHYFYRTLTLMASMVH